MKAYNNSQYLLYASTYGNYNIFTSDTNSTNKQRLTFSDELDINLQWSSNGTKIAFVSNRDDNISNTNNPVIQRLTNNPANDFLRAGRLADQKLPLG